jgi:hypothetical protein
MAICCLLPSTPKGYGLISNFDTELACRKNGGSETSLTEVCYCTIRVRVAAVDIQKQ